MGSVAPRQSAPVYWLVARDMPDKADFPETQGPHILVKWLDSAGKEIWSVEQAKPSLPKFNTAPSDPTNRRRHQDNRTRSWPCLFRTFPRPRATFSSDSGCSSPRLFRRIIWWRGNEPFARFYCCCYFVAVSSWEKSRERNCIQTIYRGHALLGCIRC